MAVSPVCSCEHYGENLLNVQVEYYERRTRIDIVFQKRIEHTDVKSRCHDRQKCAKSGASDNGLTIVRAKE